MESTLKCIYCAKLFQYASLKKRHEQSHFTQFKCKVCCKKFNFRSALLRHQKLHKRTGCVQCNKCGRSFRDDTLLKRHMKYAHKETCTCKKCNATFSSKQALYVHIKTHTPVSERRFTCSHSGCRKTFNFSHHLKHHELTHTNEKQHYCNVCGKGFIQSHHLKTHLKIHDPDNWLPCTIPGCKKKFATEYARKRHLTTHRNKSDSGISSDSNSICNSPDSDELLKAATSILCTTCGELIPRRQHAKHILKCNIYDEHISKEPLPNSFVHKTEDNEHPLAKSDVSEPKIDSDDKTANETLVSEVSNCKSALGSCIVSGDSEISNNCLCAQMSSSVGDYYDLLTPSADVENSMRSTNEQKIYNSSQNNERSNCEDCACASDNVQITKSIKTGDFANHCKSDSVMPEIEYRIDGTVKIKETFDADIAIFVDDKNKNEVNDKPFLFNSCKAVLGNCIVSGDGSIGDGCLCAKMIMDEQQMSAQEIEEITPCPKVTW